MKFTYNAGHNPDNKIACGAVGLIKESTEARKVVKEMITMTNKVGDTCYDTTVNNGTSQSDVINKIVGLTKRYDVDYHVSVHFNSGVDDEKGNGRTTGVEVLVYSDEPKVNAKAKEVCASISKQMGLKNRGVKIRKNLGFLRNTRGPAMIIECCFVDDLDDCRTYNYKGMAKAIVEGLTGKTVESNTIANRNYKNGDYDRKGRIVGTNGTGLNVRVNRDTKSEKVKNLPEGTIVNVSYCLNNWFSTYDVKHNGNPCYVSGAYIELI